MLSVKVRKAAKKDIPAIMKLSKEFHACGSNFLDENDRRLFKYKKNHLSILKRFLGKWIRARNAQVFVAETEGKIVGYMITTINRLASVYEHRKEVYIEGIFIRSGFRRKGIGRRFMNAAEDWAKERGIYSLGLNVHVRNKEACSAYKKLGFWAHNYKMSKIVGKRSQ